MWTCSKCLYDNSDRNAVCESCGTPRNNRRFTAPAVQTAAYEAPQGHPSAFNRDVPPNRQSRSHRQGEPLPPPLSKASRLMRFCGGLLSLLLPLLCILLCWRQFDVLYDALVPLLTGHAQRNALGILCYLLYCLCAVLLSLAPGLSMLVSTGKYQKKKHKEDSRLL